MDEQARLIHLHRKFGLALADHYSELVMETATPFDQCKASQEKVRHAMKMFHRAYVAWREGIPQPHDLSEIASSFFICPN